MIGCDILTKLLQLSDISAFFLTNSIEGQDVKYLDETAHLQADFLLILRVSKKEG